MTCLARCIRKVKVSVQEYTAHPGNSISWRPGIRTIMSYDRRYSRLFLVPNLKWRTTIENRAYRTLSPVWVSLENTDRFIGFARIDAQILKCSSNQDQPHVKNVFNAPTYGR
jgi:hypothetical protein